jgi:hypothetical protein
MEPIVAIFLLIAPVFVAPAYWLFTRKRKGPQNQVRIALWTILGIQLLLALPIALRLPGLLRTSVGMFDDAMYGLLGISMLSGMASAVTILLGNTLVWLYHKGLPSNKNTKP